MKRLRFQKSKDLKVVDFFESLWDIVSKVKVKSLATRAIIIIMRFVIIEKKNTHSEEVAGRLRGELLKAGFSEDVAEPEVVIVVGGDGSMLYAVQQYMEQLDKVVFVGIHTGTLGFFMDYTEDEIAGFVEDLQGGGEVKEFPILEAIFGEKKMYAVNEVRIENPMRTQDVTIYFDGAEFEKLRSSGLCVATQLGSTAYNRSLGGAILQEGMPALVFTEIAGIHHHEYKSVGVPFVMSDETEITISSNDFEGAYLGVDSIGQQLGGAGEVIIRKSREKTLRMLRMRGISHFERLQRLL